MIKRALEGGQGDKFCLDYVYQHLQEFKLIFCCSAGTEYEDYLDRLGEIEESYYLEFVRKYGQDKMTVDPFFHSCVLSCGLANNL